MSNIGTFSNVSSKFACSCFERFLILFHFRCTPGFYCPPASKSQISCEPGTYQDEFYGITCKQCPDRYFCDGLILNETHCTYGVQLPQICPQGYYCPQGSKTGKEYGCPNGKITERFLRITIQWSARSFKIGKIATLFL